MCVRKLNLGTLNVTQGDASTFGMFYITKFFLLPKQKNSPANMRRANMVKKSMQYFSDKKNRSLSEDNLFTRRKNLAVHLGLDEKVSLREIQV